MLWILCILVLGAYWFAWRLHGNRETPKDLGSDAGVDSRVSPQPTVTHYVASGVTDYDTDDEPPAPSPSPRLGTIPAWRCWRLDGTINEKGMLELRLVSWNELILWENPTMEADEIPTYQNSNGLYATKDWDDPNIPGQMDTGVARVFGRVGLYGTVVEAERGYRAQKAVIEELWFVDSVAGYNPMGDKSNALPLEIVRKILADRYQVEVHQGWPDGKTHERPRFRTW